jgi:CheY-like chemotaxis protein
MTTSNANHIHTQARILIVDDHPGTARTLGRALSQLGPGIEVIAAIGGKDAMEQVKDLPVDMLITDMMMPDMNGLELIEKLRQHPGGRPTYNILITAYDVPGLREMAQRLKVNETLIKPIPPEHICQVVSRHLEDMQKSQGAGSSFQSNDAFKILVADDMPDNVSLLARYLNDKGYRLLMASDGEETLEVLRAEKPDLVLLDVNMPKKDGFAVLQEMRSDPGISHIPVIILTANRIDSTDVQTGLNMGADDYVMKPFDRRELMARIQTKLRVKSAEDEIRRRNKELNVVMEMGNLSAMHRPLPELMEVILEVFVSGMGAKSGYILNPQKSLYKAYPFASLSLESGNASELAAELGKTEAPLIIPDTHAAGHWLAQWNEAVHSAAAVSLSDWLGGFLGVILLTHDQPGYFKPGQAELIRSVANQIAVLVDRAAVYAAMHQEKAKV